MSCPDCFKGSLDSGTPTGEETKIAGLDAYVAKPKAGSEAGGEKKAVVLITDIFGWKLLNVRLVADEVELPPSSPPILQLMIGGSSAAGTVLLRAPQLTLCTQMANRLGHEVIIPDFFLGYPVAKDAIDVFLVPAESVQAGQWGTVLPDPPL
ncbi:hypothetical protein T484DRAFT_1834443 [Baffinella frigidus]|nr:hypothetical protein T484DRAFT_1834443 [Cryptophyta sp. CCMP2293]